MFTIAEKQALLSLQEDNLTFLKNENFTKEKVYEFMEYLNKKIDIIIFENEFRNQKAAPKVINLPVPRNRNTGSDKNIEKVEEDKIAKKSSNNGTPDDEKNIEKTVEDDVIIEVEKDKITKTISEKNVEKSVENDNIHLVEEDKIAKKSANNGTPDSVEDDIEVEKDKITTKIQGNNENMKCDFDQKIFREENLIHHIKKCHMTKPKKMRDCDICGETFIPKRFRQHYYYCSKKAPFMNEIKQFQQNFQNRLTGRSSEKSTSEILLLPVSKNRKISNENENKTFKSPEMEQEIVETNSPENLIKNPGLQHHAENYHRHQLKSLFEKYPNLLNL